MQPQSSSFRSPSFASSQPLAPKSSGSYGALPRRASPGMNSANPFGYQGAYQTYQGGQRTNAGNQVRPGTSALSNGGWYNQPGQFGQYVQQPQPQGGAGPINYLQNQIAQYGASAGGSGLRGGGGGGAGYYQNQLHSFLRAPFMNQVPDWKKG